MNDILIAVIGSGALWGLIQFLIKRADDNRTRARDEMRNANTARIASLETDVGGLKAENLTQSKALREILHVLLYRKCQRVLTQIDAGEITHITTTELHEISDLYEVYAEMGGNGTGKLLYDKVKQIPLKQG